MAELNHLKQTGGVEEYQSIFEELRSLVKEIEPSLTESFYIRSFMGGLQKELRNTVQTYKPTTLEQAISLAGLLEGAFDNLITKAKSPSHSKSSTSTHFNLNHSKTSTTSSLSSYSPKTEPKTITGGAKAGTSNTTLPIKKLTPAEMQTRREQGLCYNCDEPYTFGHR